VLGLCKSVICTGHAVDGRVIVLVVGGGMEDLIKGQGSKAVCSMLPDAGCEGP